MVFHVETGGPKTPFRHADACKQHVEATLRLCWALDDAGRSRCRGRNVVVPRRCDNLHARWFLARERTQNIIPGPQTTAKAMQVQARRNISAVDNCSTSPPCWIKSDVINMFAVVFRNQSLNSWLVIVERNVLVTSPAPKWATPRSRPSSPTQMPLFPTLISRHNDIKALF